MLQPSLPAIRKEVHDTLKQYSQRSYICHCLKGVGAFQLSIGDLISEHDNFVVVGMEIIEPVMFMKFSHRCDCTCKYTHGDLKINRDIWRTNLQSATEIRAANLLWDIQDECIHFDSTHALAILVPVGILQIDNDKVFSYGEVCAGGFSGWSHAAATCQKEGISTCCKFAVELDEDACMTFSKTWSRARIVRNFSDYAFYVDAFQSGECFPLFREDVELGWWISCISRDRPDVVCVSPPCPPYSMAARGKGLGCNEGWVTVSSIVAISYLRPKIILLENVAALLKHCHWDLIRLVIESMEYSIVAKHTVNASQVSPQNRDRCLLILAQNDETLNRDVQMVFPKLPGFSLMTFGAILNDLQDLWEGVRIDDKTLAIYLDEQYLPKQNGSKKLKMDVAGYRIKLPSETFGCLMASYTFQHELPKDMLAKKGLFGNLIQQGQIIRFMSCIECMMLMHPQVDCFLPKDRRTHMKIIGNSICTSHAMFLMSSAIIMTKPDLCVKSPHDMVLETIVNRVCTFNSRVVSCDEGWWLMKIEDEYEWATIKGNPKHESTISPTLRDDRLQRVIFETKGWTMTGWIVEDMTVDQVMKIFGITDYKVINAYRTKDTLRVRLEKPVAIPISVMKCNQNESDCVVVFACGFWVMVPRDNIMCGEEVLGRLACDLQINTEEMQIHNLVGKVIQHDEIVPSVVVLANKAVSCVEFGSLKGHCFKSESGKLSIALTNCEANRFVIAMKGTNVASMCQTFGWIMTCCDNPDPFRPKQVVFRRILGEIMITTKEFLHLIQMWILQGLFHGIRHANQQDIQEGNATFVSLKFYGTKVWTGHVSKDMTIRDFMKPWMAMCELFALECPIRMVALGKNFSEEVVLSEIVANLTSITFHMVLPLHGGGAKDDQKFVTKNQLAALLLNKGLAVERVATVVDQIIQTFGAQRVAKDLKESDDEEKWSCVQQFMNKVGANLPEHSTKFVNAAMKIQKAIRKKQVGRTQTIDAHSLNIEPNFFVKEDGNACDILKTLQGAQTGVCILSCEEASAWINAKLPLSAHELAGLVIGPKCVASKTDLCRKITIPVTDSEGQPLIIRACMHQLGGKRVKIEQKNSQTVVVEKSVIVSVTIFRDECQNDLWPTIVKSPVKTIIGILESDGVKSFTCSSPWGRSWRCGSQPSEPHEATSLQFHIRVKETSLEQLLKISGRASIYVTPKDDHVGLLKGWAVVWMKIPKAELHIALAKLESDHGGIVRTNKGLGIRVKQSKFKESFAILRPADRVPMVLEAKKLFRLQPVPVGASNEDVEQITSKHGWKTRALKSMGPHAWMVASEDDPPSQWLPINDMVILVKSVEASKQFNQPTIVAGKTRQEVKNKKDGETADPWSNSQHDPWANYQASGVSQSMASVPRSSNVSIASDNPTVNKKLQEQEAKLKSLEQQVGKLAAVQQKSVETQESFQKETEKRFTSIRDDLCDQMSKVSTNFQSSLNQALQKHDTQISSQFQELKELFLSCQQNGGKASRPSKVHKGHGKAGNGVDYPVEGEDTVMGASPLRNHQQQG